MGHLLSSKIKHDTRDHNAMVVVSVIHCLCWCSGDSTKGKLNSVNREEEAMIWHHINCLRRLGERRRRGP